MVAWLARRLRLLRLAVRPPDDDWRPPLPVEALEQILSPDGEFRLVIHRRPDGLYGYRVDRYWIDDLPEYDHHEEYWAPHSGSGLFDSPAAARREAALLFPWVDQGEGAEDG